MNEFSDIEREIIVLQAMIESINSMVNCEMLRFSQGSVEIQVTFTSLAQRSLFNVLLADLLEQVDPDLLGKQGSLLDLLHLVTQKPSFTSGDLAENLVATESALRSWLDTDIQVDTWFPSIDKNLKLKLQRKQFISICGNISKHNISRLTRNSKKLAELLKLNGVTVSSVDALRALDDFHERFHNDILGYHSTTLAELLNELRWAIHEYLTPEYVRSYVPPPSDESPLYSFKYPEGVSNEYAKSRYWDLMNTVRTRPWIPHFTGTHNLKGQY